MIIIFWFAFSIQFFFTEVILTIREPVCFTGSSLLPSRRSDVARVPGAAPADRDLIFLLFMLILSEYRVNHCHERLIGICGINQNSSLLVVIAWESTFFRTAHCTCSTLPNRKGCRRRWAIRMSILRTPIRCVFGHILGIVAVHVCWIATLLNSYNGAGWNNPRSLSIWNRRNDATNLFYYRWRFDIKRRVQQTFSDSEYLYRSVHECSVLLSVLPPTAIKIIIMLLLNVRPIFLFLTSLI